MMGMTMPTQSSLTDLMTLLQLLQAASDPATAKATIEQISEARKQYDDAIAESVAKAQESRNEADKVAKETAKLEGAADKANKKLLELDIKLQEVSDAEYALAKDKEFFEVYKAEIAAQAKTLADLKVEQAEMVTKALADAEQARAEWIAATATAHAEAVAASVTKAEYENKLAQFKALV